MLAGQWAAPLPSSCKEARVRQLCQPEEIALALATVPGQQTAPVLVIDLESQTVQESAIVLAPAIDLWQATVPIESRIASNGATIEPSGETRFATRFTIIRFATFGRIIHCGALGPSRDRGAGPVGPA